MSCLQLLTVVSAICFSAHASPAISDLISRFNELDQYECILNDPKETRIVYKIIETAYKDLLDPVDASISVAAKLPVNKIFYKYRVRFEYGTNSYFIEADVYRTASIVRFIKITDRFSYPVWPILRRLY